MQIKWQPQSKQAEALVRREDEILYGGARGGGKDIHINTLVLTNRGWINAGQIQPDDLLVAPDGTYTEILGIYPKSNRRMYQITFIDGRKIVCDEEHNWLVHSKGHGKRDGWIVRKTKQLIKTPTEWSIPLVDKIDGKKWEGVDPYILGYILGDGTLVSDKEIIYTVDKDTIDYLVNAGWKAHKYDYMNTTMCNPVGEQAHSYQKILGRVSGQNKYIPKILLESDYDTRLLLLQGLMDSDGHCDKGGRASFSNNSLRLCEGVQYLVRSLGGKATINSIIRKDKTIKGYNCNPQSYKVSVTYAGKFEPFKLKRKRDRLFDTQVGDKLAIKSIIRVDNADGVCFEVEHPSHLFIVEDFIVTHNTDAGMAWLLYDIDKPRYRALVIRRNFTDLSDWIDRAKDMYFVAGGKYTGDSFEFPSGAKIKTGHLADKDAYQKYQGHEYQKMLIEELTHISRESDYEKLRASCRSTIPDIPSQIFATTNPDGAGHEWVKDRWNIPDRPDGTVLTKDETSGLTRVFIPSTLDDNPILMNSDPKYVKQIESIKDEELRRAWREGSWEGFGVEGAYYKTQLQKAREQNRITKGLYDPARPVLTWCDIGKGENYAIIFMQPRLNQWAVIDYEELKDNEGLYDGIKLMKAKHYIYSNHYAPHDMAVKDFSAQKTRQEIARDMGIDYEILPQSSVHEGIDVAKFRFPSLWFEDNENVERFIKRISRYHKEWDDARGIWKDKPAHDESSHAADCLRYWAITDYQDYDSVMSIRVSQNRMQNRGFK